MWICEINRIVSKQVLSVIRFKPLMHFCRELANAKFALFWRNFLASKTVVAEFFDKYYVWVVTVFTREWGEPKLWKLENNSKLYPFLFLQWNHIYRPGQIGVPSDFVFCPRCQKSTMSNRNSGQLSHESFTIVILSDFLSNAPRNRRN